MLRKFEPTQESYNNYLQDSNLTPISTTHSAFNGLMQGIGTNQQMAEAIGSTFTGVPLRDENLHTMMDMFERENYSPQQGVGQVSANVLSNMIGSSLGTGYLGKVGAGAVGMAFGQVAKKALPQAVENFAKKPLTRIFGENVEQYLPKTAVEEGKRTMNVGEAAAHLTSSYGAGAGFVLPQAVAENYNADTNSINWGGVAKESLGYGGAMGLAIDVFPYTAGVIWGKTKGLLGELDKMPMPGALKDVVPHEVLSGEESGAQHHPTLDKLWKAHESGKISLDEYKWMRNYLVNPSNLEQMKQSAVSILMKDGHPVDSAQLNVMLHLMKPEDATSFLTAVSDQLGSAVDKTADTAMSDYVVNNGLDRLQSDPKLLPGIKGFYEFISNKLENKPEHLGRFERMREEPQEHINNSHPFSQQNIYTAEKNGAESPHTVPENVSQRLKQEGRIAELKEKLQRFIGKAMPKELGEAKGAAEKEFTKADKDLTKAQGKLDRSIDKLGEHEVNVNKAEKKLYGYSEKEVPELIPVFTETSKGTKAWYYLGEGKENVGSVDLLSYKDGFKTHFVGVDEAEQGKGYAKYIYKKMIDDLAERGFKFYSSDELLPGGQALYKSLIKDGYEFQLNKTAKFIDNVVTGKKDKMVSEDGKPIYEFKGKSKKLLEKEKSFKELIHKRIDINEQNKKLSQAIKFAKAAHKNAIKKLKHIEGKIREHAEKLKAQGKSVQVFDRIKKIEEKLEKLRKNLSEILHPDDELIKIEKDLIKENGTLPKNFRSTNAYQRLHDLAQISDRAKMLLHHVELLREYEKQEGYKNIADILIQMSEKGFRKIADGDRVVSYLKDRVEQSSGLKEAVKEKAEPLKEEGVPADAEQMLEQQAHEQKTESEEHKEAYDQAKAKFDEFKKSENIFKNFINCVMGSSNG